MVRTTHFALWCLILLCAAFGAALGGGLYEHFVLVPLWSKSPPASFAIIQPETGVPLQRFWIPVHSAITLAMIAALASNWRDRPVRKLLVAAAVSYVAMRAWSGVFFIPEMLAFQKVPLEGPSSPELTARVASWTFWSWFREPLDVISLLCCFLALYSFRRSGQLSNGVRGNDRA